MMNSMNMHIKIELLSEVVLFEIIYFLEVDAAIFSY